MLLRKPYIPIIHHESGLVDAHSTSKKRRPGGLLQMVRDYPAGCGLLQASWANSPGLTAMVQLAEQWSEQPECEKECCMMP